MCRLVSSEVGSLPFPHPATGEEITTGAIGLVGIFPSLIGIHSRVRLGWSLLRLRARNLNYLEFNR